MGSVFSDVVLAHVQYITSVPVVRNTYWNLVHVIFENLVVNVQTLNTMGKLRDKKRYFKFTPDKLLGITADLVKLDDSNTDVKI